MTMQEFESYVKEAIDNTGVRAIGYNLIKPFDVEIMFKSASGKKTWRSFLEFEEDGSYTYTEGYPGAAGPWVIGNYIAKKIKLAK